MNFIYNAIDYSTTFILARITINKYNIINIKKKNYFLKIKYHLLVILFRLTNT